MGRTVGDTQRNPPGWRFGVGVGLFGLGLVCPVFVPLVAASDLSAEAKTLTSGLLMLGVPELLWIVAAAVLGKDGFDAMRTRAWAVFKRYALPEEVSRTRHRIGVAMFALPLFLGWIAPYVQDLVPGYETHRFALGLAGDLLLLGSLFVLGGRFWDKLRALFLYQAAVQSEARAGASTVAG